jgi:hypothetical protein
MEQPARVAFTAQRSVKLGQWKMATQRSRALQQAVATWLDNQAVSFDVAVCLHLPNQFRAEHGASERTLQKALRRFFEKLDRKVLKSAHRRRKAKVPRFVILEHDDAVGWHMHALLSSSNTGYSTEQLSQTAKLLWIEEFARSTTNLSFEPYMAWAEPVQHGHANYITKNVFTPTPKAVFDDMNTVFG